MKIIKLLSTIIFMLFMITQTSIAQNDEKLPDDLGLVLGQLIDEETGKPVNERFKICLFKWDDRSENHEYRINCLNETDESGRFTIQLIPGTFGALFYSQSKTPKYASAHHPFYNKMPEAYREYFTTKITVEKNRVTRLVKTIKLGGAIKIVLEDLSGNLIDPQKVFPGRFIRVEANISNFNLNSDRKCAGGWVDNGQLIMHGFFPDGEYELKLEFRGIGYADIIKKDIMVRAKEITEIQIPIDINDQTGLEGKITDKQGNPYKNANIYFNFTEKHSGIPAKCWTDNNGYYLMTGLTPGKYEISVIHGNRSYMRFKKLIVDIIKGTLLRKNIILPLTD